MKEQSHMSYVPCAKSVPSNRRRTHITGEETFAPTNFPQPCG